MISCVNPFVLSLQCFSFKSCANAVLQLCQLRDRITSHSLQRMHQILVWW
jgi:hypothetical protein